MTPKMRWLIFGSGWVLAAGLLFILLRNATTSDRDHRAATESLLRHLIAWCKLYQDAYADVPDWSDIEQEGLAWGAKTDEGELLDYWGNPIRALYRGPSDLTLYSFGANGVDERGGGDDVAIEIGHQ